MRRARGWMPDNEVALLDTEDLEMVYALLSAPDQRRFRLLGNLPCDEDGAGGAPLWAFVGLRNLHPWACLRVLADLTKWGLLEREYVPDEVMLEFWAGRAQQTERLRQTLGPAFRHGLYIWRWCGLTHLFARQKLRASPQFYDDTDRWRRYAPGPAAQKPHRMLRTLPGGSLCLLVLLLVVALGLVPAGSQEGFVVGMASIVTGAILIRLERLGRK